MKEPSRVVQGIHERAGGPAQPEPEPGVPAAVELHIEELLLRGFAPGERYRIGDAVRRELARLITEQGLPGLVSDSEAIERIDGGEFRVALGSAAQGVGVQVAEAVYRGLVLETRSSGRSSSVRPATRAHPR